MQARLSRINQSIEALFTASWEHKSTQKAAFWHKGGRGGGGGVGNKASLERVSSFDGLREKTTRLGTERGKISDSSGSSNG